MPLSPSRGSLTLVRLRILPWMLVAAAVGFTAAGVGRFELALPALGGAARQAAPTAIVRSGANVAADERAIRDAIRRANEAQATAFNTNDETAMRATATTSFYDLMTRTNADLRASGVTSITLVQLSFDTVTVTADTATATTTETWRSDFADGSSATSVGSNDYSLVRDGAAWKIDTNTQTAPAAVAPRTPLTPTVPGAPDAPTAPAAAASTSTNWSGYAAANGTYTSVSGTWIVPTVSATTAGADATWVGIGGLTSRDLIQAGTQATVQGGTVVYTAWTETLPQSSRTVPLTVRAGDTVTVTITERATGVWDVTIHDDTTGGAYTNSVRYASTRSSAEWIEEVPSVGRGTLPLTDFGSVRFLRASATRDGQTVDLRSSGAHAITMINGAGQAVARPSEIGVDGKSFVVTRTSAPSGGSQYPEGRRRRG